MGLGSGSFEHVVVVVVAAASHHSLLAGPFAGKVQRDPVVEVEVAPSSFFFPERDLFWGHVEPEGHNYYLHH